MLNTLSIFSLVIDQQKTTDWIFKDAEIFLRMSIFIAIGNCIKCRGVCFDVIDMSMTVL